MVTTKRYLDIYKSLLFSDKILSTQKLNMS